MLVYPESLGSEDVGAGALGTGTGCGSVLPPAWAMAGSVKAKFRTKTRKETLDRIFFHLRGRTKVPGGASRPGTYVEVRILLSIVDRRLRAHARTIVREMAIFQQLSG